MWRFRVNLLAPPKQIRNYSTSASQSPIILIKNCTFFRHHPNSHLGGSDTNSPLFRDLSFSLDSFSSKPKYWAVIGPSSSGKTTFLQILRGRHISIPPGARAFPYLESDDIERKDHSLRNVEKAIQQVGFDGEGRGANVHQTAYLAARYESRRESTDFSVLNYLLGNTELNPAQDIDGKPIHPKTLERVIKDLRLEDLAEMPISNLSNGQTRRARIAKALLGNPEVLLLDEPFMGLDPPTLLTLSTMLERLAKASNPRLILSLRPQDPIPEWITHLVFLKGNCEVAFHGDKEAVLTDLKDYVVQVRKGTSPPDPHMSLLFVDEVGRRLTKNGIIEPCQLVAQATNEVFKNSKMTQKIENPDDSCQSLSRDGYKLHDEASKASTKASEVLVEMKGAVVSYGNKTVLGKWEHNVHGEVRDGLWWTIRRGERWGIFGPNGSGKTTILSLICSDHPQTYSLPIKLFGRARIPEPGQLGVSIFDIQARIGHSSPEIHNHLPRSFTLRKILQSAWAETFTGIPRLDTAANERIDACLRWFEQDLRPSAGSESLIPDEGNVLKHSQQQQLQKAISDPTWADELIFGRLPFSSQRIALFLRAIIKHPDIVILDEAFSGMDDGLRDRCLLFLAHGETKQFSYNSKGLDGPSNTTQQGVRIGESDVSRAGQVKVSGLTDKQALLCISHVREEIPGSIREWICLPEANTGKPARFGRLDGPIEGDYRRWNEIWGM